MNELLKSSAADPDVNEELAHALARLDELHQLPQLETKPPAAAFYRYQRTLTADGGFQIIYSELVAGPLIDLLRITGWLATSAVSAWLLLKLPFSLGTTAPACIASAGLLAALIWRKRFRMHMIEIRPDGMIVDGRFFDIEGFEENWPQLQMKYENENRLVLCGRYGTRFIEFATAYRYDTNDRTPERLADDLELAMEQLWGRREAIVPIPY
jgi:hypothetical protein